MLCLIRQWTTGAGRAGPAILPNDEIIRTTAPMHAGFAGGAFVDTRRRVLGVATAAEIRGLGVVIPAAIAWTVAEALLAHGHIPRGYLGVAGQAVGLAGAQRDAAAADRALLVVTVRFDGEPIDSADRLLQLLDGSRIGRAVPVAVLRGLSAVDLAVTVAGR